MVNSAMYHAIFLDNVLNQGIPQVTSTLGSLIEIEYLAEVFLILSNFVPKVADAHSKYNASLCRRCNGVLKGIDSCHITTTICYFKIYLYGNQVDCWCIGVIKINLLNLRSADNDVVQF